MKSFLFKFCLFVILLQIPFLIEGLLPYDQFPGPILAKRYTSIYGNHFPNTKTTISEKGNLSYGTNSGVVKNYSVTIDNLGLRNDSVLRNPDIVLIGDSQIYCATIDQENILSKQIMDQTPWVVYNVNTSTPNVFAQLLEDRVISKPKWVIYERIEREIQDFHYSINPFQGYVAKGMSFLAQNKYSQIITNFISKYTRQHLKEYLRTEFFGRTTFPKSIDDYDLFFHDGRNSSVEMSSERLEELTNDIVKVKDYFESRDINFAFMPFPNKETIYWEKVPYEHQPVFMNNLVSMLEKKGVKVIPTHKFLLEKRNPYLYHKDDTHWNELGISIVAKEIVDFINFQESK